MGGVSETFVRRHVYEVADAPAAVFTLREHVGRLRGWDSPPDTYRIEDSNSLARRALLRAWRATVGARGARKRFRLFVDQVKPCAVMIEYLDYSWRTIPLWSGLDIPVYPHGHGFDVSALLREPKWVHRVQELAAHSDGFIVVSHHVERRLRALGVTCPIHVFPCGVDPVPHARKTLCKVAKHFLFVGRFAAKKGPVEVVKAFAQAQRAVGCLTLTMVGGGSLEQAAREEAESQGVQQDVRFLGFRPSQEVLQLMQDCDVFIQHNLTDPATGDEEGLPVAILEAMGSGMPVLTTRHAGIPEAVTDGEAGLIVEEGDVEAMSDAIRQVASDSKLYGRLALGAYERCRERFSFQRERADLRELLGLNS